MIYRMVESVGVKNISNETAKELIEYIDNDIQNINIERIMEIINKEKGDDKKMAGKKEFMTRQSKVESFMHDHPEIKTYREAVLQSGVGTEEDFLNPDEVVRLAKLCDDAIASINLLKDSSVFGGTTQTKLNQAYQIVNNAKAELELLAKKQD